MWTSKKSIFKGVVYLLAQVVWFFIVAIPLALSLYIFVELVSLIKSTIIKCQRTIMK